MIRFVIGWILQRGSEKQIVAGGWGVRDDFDANDEISA